jgi:uncharacterized protein YcbK (DUF882 family)
MTSRRSGRVLICDCHAYGNQGWSPMRGGGYAAQLTRRALLTSASAATAMALASPATAHAPIWEGPNRQSEPRLPRRGGAKHSQPTTCEAPSTLQWPAGVSEHRLALRNADTGETFDGVIWANGRFDVEALARLNALMRDTHSGTITTCDARLFDLLACVQAHLCGLFYILSGFRTPETNAALARSDSHVAPNSFHIRGMAADVYVAGVPPSEVAQKAREVGAGGIGTSATSVHLDTGPVRSWTF